MELSVRVKYVRDKNIMVMISHKHDTHLNRRALLTGQAPLGHLTCPPEPRHSLLVLRRVQAVVLALELRDAVVHEPLVEILAWMREVK